MPKEDKSSDMETEKTAVFSGGNTSFIKKILNKFKKGSKKRLLWIVGAILLLIVISTAAWAAWWSITPYATVDGQQISRAQYDSMESKMAQFYKYNKDKNVQQSAEKAAKDRLIEEKIIESEAKKRGITASTEEINKRYQKIVSQYSSEAEYIKTIKNAYNWTPELTKQTIKIDILTEKLKKVVLKGYDVSYSFVRYDMISKTDDPNALPIIQKIYNQLQSGKKWETVFAEYKSSKLLYTSWGTDEGVNSVTQLYPDPAEWQAISKLKSGDITKIIKSNAGYYIIYHADKVNNGTYMTWQDFINYYKKKYVSYGYINKLIGFLYNNFINQKVHAVGICEAQYCPRGGSANQPYHPMIYTGDVRDANTGALLADVSVHITPDSTPNYSVQCDGEHINAVFDRTVKSVGVNVFSALNWADYGSQQEVNFHIGAKRSVSNCLDNNGDIKTEAILNGPDCHIAWTVNFSKDGYQSYSGPNGNITNTAGSFWNGKIYFVSIALSPIEKPWTITPTTTVAINGVAAPGGGQINPSQTATWTHTIKNTGPGPNATNAVLNYWGKNVPPNFPTGTFTTPAVPSGFGYNASKSFTSSSYTIKASPTDDNKTFCRSTVVKPYLSSNLTLERESGPVCVYTGAPPPITSGWALQGSSAVSPSTAIKGQSVTFTHDIWNNSSQNMDKAFDSTVKWYSGSGSVVWVYGYGDTIGLPSTFGSHPALSAGLHIDTNGSVAGNQLRINKFTIPSTANSGDTFCQDITFTWPTNSGEMPQGSSTAACVTVSLPPSNYVLTPHVTLNPPKYIEAGEQVIVTPSVDNSGPTVSQPTTWELTRTVNSGPATTLKGPVPSVVFPAGITTLTDYPDSDTNNFVVGTHICYVLSVTPHSSSDSSTAVSSPPNPPSPPAVCVVIVKKPKTQIWAGDLLVGGDVNTSTSTKSGNTYGSWAEYGIIASGGISGAASGAAFAGPTGLSGATVCGYSKLSFTNAGTSSCSSATLIGHYTNTSTMPDVKAFFSGGTPINVPAISPHALDGINTRAGDLILNQGINLNKSVIIIATGTVTIKDDQTYANGPYTKISQLPQLVIIAKSIVINADVDRVDAWLVATDGGNGTIYTCDTDSRTTNDCTKQLQVNGPVMANQLYLRRTAGSDSSDLGKPAEIFNLRADAYLWAINQSSNKTYIQTVYNTELPPRY